MFLCTSVGCLNHARWHRGYRRGRLAEWLQRSRNDQEVVSTNPSYYSVFDTAASFKLLTSGIASPLMQLAIREPGVNLIIIIIMRKHCGETSDRHTVRQTTQHVRKSLSAVCLSSI
jgi:hypothetical protein